MNKDLGIYIHIPFCISKCYYCDFVSYESSKEDVIKNYIDSLCNEVLQNFEIISSRNISSIYIGGGTPSYIPATYIKQILDTIKLVTNITDNTSITIEVNPKTITKEKVQIYKECNINRISIGLQSTHDEVLIASGRKHTFEDFKTTIKLFKEAGFSNISADIIYPLPKLTLPKFTESLNTICNMDEIKHISVYNLEVHENTKLDFLLKEGFATLVDEDEEYEMKEALDSILTSNNFNRYEISNYSKKGYESKHNLLYWNQGEYLGFGINSSSFVNSTRYTNIADIDKYMSIYLNNLNEESISQINELSDEELMKEYVILKLRLQNGVNKEEFKYKFKLDITKVFKEAIDLNIRKELLINDSNNIYLTSKGLEVANIVWESFI